ncbi:MAG: peptidase S41 [Streptosporangiales bacterium]|nr:peptidase S41 [Streptosporangiales bacterium]
MTASGYLRYPHLHGDLLTFVAEDDVWIAPIAGGRGWRLSADGVPVTHPRFSPDGRWVAWTSRRDADPEVHVAPADGGESRRLTYWGSPDTRVCGWTPDGAVLALSSWRQPFSHYTHAYAVPVDGEPARSMGWGPVGGAAIGPDGAVLIVTVAAQEPARWKGYRGGGMGRLWVNHGDGFVRILADLDGNLDCPLWVGDRLAFLSDHEDVAHLYSCRPDGSDLRRHADHPESFYVRHASTDGDRVIYGRAGELWLLDGLDATPYRLDVRPGGPRTGRHPSPVYPSVDDLSCDRTGRGSAVEVRGGVHWITHRDGPARALAVAPGVRTRLPRVLGDSGQVAWVTSADGDDALEIAPTTDTDQAASPRRLAAGLLGRVDDLVAAPDGKKVAVAAHDGRLLLVDVATGEVEELAISDNGPVTGLCFSPDSAWLAWSHPGPGHAPLSHIRLARIDGPAAGDPPAGDPAANEGAANEGAANEGAANEGADGVTIVDVTDGRFIDTDPVFSMDGAHLIFLSWRGFDPVYDSHIFDLSFPFGCRPYLVPLTDSARSPFAPTPQGRPPGTEGGDGGDAEEEPATVGLDGIAARVVPFPVQEARYSSLYPVKGGVVWLRMPLTGMLGESGSEPGDTRPKPSLERYDLGKLRCEEIVDGLDWVEVSGDGEYMVISRDGNLRVLPTGGTEGEAGDKAFDVDLSRLRITADPVAEWGQAYDEAGRVIRDYFWTRDMAGIDWDGALARYRPLLDRITTPDDFADLLWELFGELRTSHAYVSGAGSHGGDRWMGLLGADLERDGDGVWRVTRVLPAETSDPYARSPLAAPGAGVMPGDALLAVDGRPVEPDAGPGPLLVGAADKLVELTIAPRDGGGDGRPVRRVVVRPLFNDRRLRYQAWVNDRRARVRERSDGRLGYLHIPDMTGIGWAQFHRDLRVEIVNPGLVLDIRGNSGGIVSELVVEKLARRVVAWDVGRHRRPVSYPADAPRGQVVVLADDHTASDGDILAAAIRALGLGTVVGTRTWGGVIGIHYHRLVEGTYITVPRYATWFDGHGWGLENRGVDPDVEVEMTPDDWAEDRDPQLDAAVRIALERLQSHPPATPPDRP